MRALGLQRRAAPHAGVRRSAPSSPASPASSRLVERQHLARLDQPRRRRIDVLVIAVIGGLYRHRGRLDRRDSSSSSSTTRRRQVDFIGERFNTVIGVVFLVIVLLSPGGLDGHLATRQDRERRPRAVRRSAHAGAGRRAVGGNGRSEPEDGTGVPRNEATEARARAAGRMRVAPVARTDERPQASGSRLTAARRRMQEVRRLQRYCRDGRRRGTVPLAPRGAVRPSSPAACRGDERRRRRDVAASATADGRPSRDRGRRRRRRSRSVILSELRGRVRAVLRADVAGAALAFIDRGRRRPRRGKPVRRRRRARSWPATRSRSMTTAARTTRPRRRSTRPGAWSSRWASTSSSARSRATRASPWRTTPRSTRTVTFVNGTSGAQDTTLKVQVAELLPLQHGRRAVDGRSRRLRLQRARLAQRRHDRRRLHFPYTQVGGLRGRVLLARRQGHRAALAGAGRGGLLVVHRPDPGRRRRLLPRRRRHRHGGIRRSSTRSSRATSATRSWAASS